MSDEWSLVMPFVAVASKGGPFDDAAYAAGWEMGSLRGRIRPGVETVRSSNLPQVDLIAMETGLSVTVKSDDGEWATIELVGRD